jgi:hypothetical protein
MSSFVVVADLKSRESEIIQESIKSAISVVISKLFCL